MGAVAALASPALASDASLLRPVIAYQRPGYGPYKAKEADRGQVARSCQDKKFSAYLFHALSPSSFRCGLEPGGRQRSKVSASVSTTPPGWMRRRK